MLAGVLERLLKSYLSRWLSVTASHLQVLKLGVWNGDLHFEQLHMLSSVLDELQLPLGLGVKLKKGMIGSLQLKCNWARLMTQPVEIILEDVYLLGEIDPRRMQQESAERAAEEIAQMIDPEVIRQYMQKQKQQIIEAAEQTWAEFRRESNTANQSYMSSLSASLVASILENLSVTVRRIHVCVATMPRPEAPMHEDPSMATFAVDSSSTSPGELISPQPLVHALSAHPTTAPVPPIQPPRVAHAAAASVTPSSGAAATAAASPVDPIAAFPVGWSLGVLLNELLFHTTDKAGASTYVKSASGTSVYKRVRLEGLAVYLSSNATPLPDAAAGSDEYFMRIMARPFKKGAIDETHDESDDVQATESHDKHFEAPESEHEASDHESDHHDSPSVSRRSATSVDSDDSDADLFQDAREPPPGSISTSPVIVPLSRQSSAQASPQLASAATSTVKAPQVIDGLEYILAPCDATVKLRFSKHQSRTDETGSSSTSTSAADKRAKLSVSIDVENLQLEFTSKQYEIVQALAANISSSEHLLRHAPFIAPRMRPGHSQQVTRAWWAYALQVTRKECRERLQQWRPSYIAAYRQDFHVYTPLYTAYIAGKATASQKADMQHLEDGWDAHHVIMWRSLIQKGERIKEAVAHVNKARGKKRGKGGRKGTDPNESTTGAPSSVMGWLGSWLPGQSGDTSDADDDDATSIRLSEEEREQILKMLGYDPYASIDQLQQSSESAMKVDFKLGKASITLFHATIDLTSPPLIFVPGQRPPRIDFSMLPTFPLAPRSHTTRQAFLHASLDDFRVHMQQSTSGVSVELSLDHLLVEDHMASCERFHTLIVPRARHPRHAGGTRGTPFMTPQRPPSHQLPATSHQPATPVTPSSSSADPPLVQMRLSYHFPSTHLTSSASVSQAHVDLWLATQPLDVVYSAGVIASLQTFLVTSAAATAASPEEAGFNVLWQELEVAAMNAFQDLKRRSAAKLEYVLHHHVRIALDVNIQAPTLLIYHHSAADLGSCLAINLGHLTCVTQEKHTAIVEEPADGHNALRKSSADAGSRLVGASVEAAMARERALSSSLDDAGVTAGLSPEARIELFYDQFHLNIGNVDVQLIPLHEGLPKGRSSVPLSSSLGPFSDVPSAIPSLQLPASASAPAPSPSPQRRVSSRRTWLARRHKLASRSAHASLWGCGPVIDAFTPTVHVMSSVLPTDTSLPRMKVHAHLPPLRLHLSSAKMRRILHILSSFPSAPPPPPPPTLPANTPNVPQGPLTRASSLGGISPSSSAPTSRVSQAGTAANRRSSSFQISKESAVATAAQMVGTKEKDSKAASVTQLPTDWVMLHFHLTAAQLAIDLSFDCDLPPEEAQQLSSPEYGAHQAAAPSESTIELVSFLLDGVDLAFTQFPYSLALETQVHGLFVEDCINREHAQFRYLISSGSSPAVTMSAAEESKESTASAAPQRSDLICVKFSHKADASPTASVASADSLSVDVNTLNFNWNQSTFALLVEFIQPALDAMAEPPAAVAPPSQPAAASVPHHHTVLSVASDATTIDLSRSVDYTASQLHSHSHTNSLSSTVPINMSASMTNLPSEAAVTTSSNPPTGMHIHTDSISSNSSIPATPIRTFSVGSIATPLSAGGTGPHLLAPTQQDLLTRINDKIANDGEIGSRASRTKPSASSLHLHARISLITLSLNTEKDDSITSIATTEIQGLDVTVKQQDCPCGGCLQVDAQLANLTLFEMTTTVSDTFSTASRLSETRSAHLRPPFMSQLSNDNWRHDTLSPVHIQSDTTSQRGGSGSSGFGSRSNMHARRIASKRQTTSDTPLLSFSLTQHALVMEPPTAGAPSSASCPIRFRTIRNAEAILPVDPATLSFDQTIGVNVSSIQLVFVPDFLLRLQSYIEEIVPKETSDRAAEKAKAAFTEMKQMAEANCSLLKYSVAIDNPLVFVPHTTTAPINHPYHSPESPNPSLSLSATMSPAALAISPSTPRDSQPSYMGYQHSHLYDDVRTVTDYLVLDLGKISLANQFQLSDERHQLVPPSEMGAPPGSSVLLSPRRRRKLQAGSGRVPTEEIQLRLTAINLILASTGSTDPDAQSDDAGLFWSHARKIKIFEDVDVHARVTALMLTPHLAFIDVPNMRIAGTVSTIHAHISEQLLTFLLGVYTVELAPLLASTPPKSQADDLDDMMEMEFEQDVRPPPASKPATPVPPSRTASVGSLAHSASTASIDADAAAALSAEAMASIDEEFFDDDDEAAEEPVLLAHTTESVDMTIDLSFEGVLLDLMLMSSTADVPESVPSQLRTHRSSTSASFLSPLQPSFSSSLHTAPPLGSFSFAPVVPPAAAPSQWSNWSRQAHSFAQIRARSLAVSLKTTNIVRIELNAAPLRSSLTALELSLGHLSLEDMRAECTHPLLKQIIGGHHDLASSRASTRPLEHTRAASVAFDLATASSSQSTTSPDSAASPSASTVLPDLTVKFESLSVERPKSESAISELTSTASSVEQVTVEMSVDVEFTAPRVVISPNFLTATMNFVETYSGLLETNTSVSNESVNAVPAPEPVVAGSPAPIVETRIHARIRDPQVWLMSDADAVVPHATNFAPSPTPDWNMQSATASELRHPRSSFSMPARPLSCVVLRCNLETTVKMAANTAVQVTLADIESLMCYRANVLKLVHLNPLPVPIFQPFSVKLEYQLRNNEATLNSAARDAAASSHLASPPPVDAPPAPAIEHHLTVEVSRVDSCFSFLQMSSAANIILALTQALPQSEVDPTATKAKPSSVDVAAASPVAFLATFKGVVQLRTSGIHLKLVNDAPGYYVPLLSFSISPLLLSILDAAHPESIHFDQLAEKSVANDATPSYLPASRFSSGVTRPPRRGATLFVTTGLQANYYNQQLGGEWEKFLDGWLFDIRADEQAIRLSSKQVLELQVTPSCVHALAQGMDSLQSHFLAVLAAPPVATPRKKSSRRQPRGSISQPLVSTKVASQPTERKASYFRVRNETGARLRFWSVEAEQDNVASVPGSSSASSSKATSIFTVDPNDEQTVALRQYIGVGGFGLDADDVAGNDGDEEKNSSEEQKPRWLYRSPMVGLQLEAGLNTDRWKAWEPIRAVPLVASSTEAAVEASRKAAATNRLHAHANLTLHPLLPSSEDDAPFDENAEDIANGVIACHLVSQTDADGSSAQVLVVSSALLLVNRTFVDMEICLVDTIDECVLFQRTVQSGQSLPMPVLLVSWRRVKLLLRPAGLSFRKTVWNWSTAGFRLSLLSVEAANHTILKCKPHEQDFPISPLQASPQAPLSTDVFCCGLNIFSTSASSDIVQTDATASMSPYGAIDPTLFTIALDPPLSFKNLLGCDVSYQVTLRERLPNASYLATTIDDLCVTGVHSGFLPHRQEVHWYHMDLGASSSSVVTLQLRRSQGLNAATSDLSASTVVTPRSSVSRSTSFSHLHAVRGLASAISGSSVGDWSHEWSREVVIHSTATGTHPSSTLILQDGEGVRLGIHLDYSGAQHHEQVKSASASVYPYAHAGRGLVTASVPYWFANHSGLPLVYASLDEQVVDMAQPCAGQSRRSLEHAAQALMDLEGIDELAQRLTADASNARSWFHFKDARQEFGAETRTGLAALLDDADHLSNHGVVSAAKPDWLWTPELARRPLDENVFLLSPVSNSNPESDSRQQQVEVYMLPQRHGEKLRAMVRLPNTDWSQPFNVDTVGWDGALQLTEKYRVPRSKDMPTTADSSYNLPPQTDRPLRVYSLGVGITLHSHLRYHRTKIIRFTPRYVLSNQTLHTIEFRQTGSQEARTIQPKQQVPIHWLDQGGRAALSLRVGAYGWQWAAKRFGIALESVGVFSVRLRNSHTHDTAVMHIWTKLVGATFEITILATWEQHQLQQQARRVGPEAPLAMTHAGVQAQPVPPTPHRAASTPWMSQSGLDLPAMMSASQHQQASPQVPTLSADDRDLQEKIAEEMRGVQEQVPYRIENCSLRTLLFHQVDEPSLKQRLLPFQSCPYAWDEPMGRKQIVLSCLSGVGATSLHDESGLEEQRVGAYSLDKIARYDPVWLRSSRARPGDPDEMQVQDQVIAQVYADGRVRVLKLVELTYANSAGLNPLQAILNAQASDPRALAPTNNAGGGSGWSVEVRLAGIGLSLITHVQRAGVAPAFIAPVSGASHLRTSSMLGGHSVTSTSHPLALLGAPYTRQELLYLSIQNIRIRLNESSTNQAVKAAIGHIQLDNQLHTAAYPVVLCSVNKPQSSGGWFSSKKKSSHLSDLDLDDDFFHLHPTGANLASGGVGTPKIRAPSRAKKDILPCWLSVALLKSHERSTSDFLFLPGLAVRMQLLKINIEEKLINHLVRFGELLGPALALLSKPTPIPTAPVDDSLGSHYSTAPILERQSSQALLEIALHDGTDYASSSPMPMRSALYSLPASDLGDEHELTGSRTPTSLGDSALLDEDAEEADDLVKSQHYAGIVGRLTLPPLTTVPPLSSLEYSRVGPLHPPRLERAESDLPESTRGSSSKKASAVEPKKLERSLIMYFEHLFLETIEIQVSMSASGEQDDAILSSSSHPLRVLLRAVGATLLNFEDASLKFGALDLPDVFASGEELGALLQLHYINQATRQAYNVLGSSDFLGNPLALFGAISTGFGELVYQPVAGLTQSPVGVVTGALGGVRSFAQHALYGVTSTTRSIFSAVGKGLSSASMSEQHRSGRTMSLAELPIRGWKRAGVSGFVGGSLRAALGWTGRLANSLSTSADRLRALVNPVPRLLRAREPLYFAQGTRPRLYALDVARFISEYLAQHSDETFVGCIEQEAAAVSSVLGERRLFGLRTFSGHTAYIKEEPKVQPLGSSSSAAASSSPMLTALAPGALRVPLGGRVCLLLTTQTLVAFCVFPSSASMAQRRRAGLLLREIPLATLVTPIETAPNETLLTLEPPALGESFERRRGGAVAARHQRARTGVVQRPVSTASFLQTVLPFLFGAPPTVANEVVRLPVHMPPPFVAQITLLAAAARASQEQERRARRL